MLSDFVCYFWVGDAGWNVWSLKSGVWSAKWIPIAIGIALQTSHSGLVLVELEGNPPKAPMAIFNRVYGSN